MCVNNPMNFRYSFSVDEDIKTEIKSKIKISPTGYMYEL